jgi:simple sugar transport system substrate-binding protein/basic membrane protein A
MNKLYWVLGLLVIVVLGLTACAQQPAPVQEAAPAAQEEATPAQEQATPAEEEAAAPAEAGKGKLGLILTGPIDDNSWNEAAYSAMKALEADGVEVVFSERTPYPDTARLLREMADNGYQMIVGHSFGHQDAVFEVAEEYPDVNFAWGGGIGETAKNVADYDQPFYQAAYLVGIIAGHVSESGKLGAVYAFDIPVCHAMGEALLAGAKTVNPDAELLSTASGDWYDISKAKEAALAQAEAGVDYWIGCGQGPTFGTIEAAKEQGGYTTGYVGDMTEAGPDVILTNVVWNLEPMFRSMMESTLNGTFDGPYYDYGIKEGALDISINPALADLIPAEAMAKVEEVKAQIISGEFEVPFVPTAEESQ